MEPRIASNILATWVGVLAAVVGGYATYSQYEKSVAQTIDQRSLTALGFVDKFQSEHFMEIRETVYSHVFCRTPENCSATKPTNSQMFAFIELFDAVAYCADKNICDPQIVDDLFGSYATWHWPCLEPFVMGVRAGESEMELSRPYGVGLESLTILDVGDQHCGNLRRW